MPLAARTNRGSTFTKRNKMNSKKFLDQLGLIALISKIKQALNGKQNVDMVVTITQSGNAYSCDTSIANIVAAHDAGRDVYAVLPPVSDGSSTKIELVEVQNYGSGTVMMVSFGDIINNGTNNVLYSVSGTRQNNLDAWSVSQKTMQDKLVSGTSIKTVNGNTLLGSGDVTINGSERVTATWNASTSAYVSGASVDNMYQSFYTDGKVLELHLVNGSYNGMVLTCHGGYTDGSVRHMKFSGVTDDWIVSCDVVGTVVTVTYTSLFDIYEELNGKQDTIGLNNKVDADYVEYRGADTSRLGNGDSMTEALQTLDAAITNLGTPNEIASITTQESSASGGNNVVTITDTDGTSTSFNVKNGKDGKDGADGADGADGVSLGEIALVQTTGDATDAVMSQKAVTDYGQKVTNENLAGTSEWIKRKRIEDGWEFDKGIRSGETASSSFCISPYIPISNIKGHSITFGHMLGYQGQFGAAFYNSAKVYITGTYYSYVYNASYRTVTIGTSDSLDDIAFVRITANPSRLNECYIKDDTTGEYVFDGQEYLNQLTNDLNVPYLYLCNNVITQELGNSEKKVISQKIITEKLEDVKYSWVKVNYINGRLISFNLADYPEFDPRTADGISIMFTVDSTSGANTPLFNIHNPSAGINGGFGASHFGLWWWNNSLIFGRLKNYSGYDTGGGGYSVTRVRGHYVFTYNFKTGEYKCYKNGVLTNQNTPDSWDEQTMIRDYLASMTKISMTATPLGGTKFLGIALFGSVLTDSDVTSLYGSGTASVKDTLVPSIWRANYLHPVEVTDWTLHVANGVKTGDYTITPPTSGNWIRFGFSDLSGFLNNCIYEWDFEITSGYCEHTGGYSRRFNLNGRYLTGIYTITNSNGSDVTLETLTVGTYHVVCKPDNIANGGVNVAANSMLYILQGYSSDFSMTILPTLKITERGCALECSPSTFFGDGWLQNNGIKIPINNYIIYGDSAFVAGTDSFIDNIVTYSSSVYPQFNGQIAVDTTNGKVYIGYLTGTGGTWKQVSN